MKTSSRETPSALPREQRETSADELAYRLRQQDAAARVRPPGTRNPGFPEAAPGCEPALRRGTAYPILQRPWNTSQRSQSIVRVGVGSGPAVIGSRTGAGSWTARPAMPSRRASRSYRSHLENEDRFRTPQALVEHGIRRAINVPISAAGRRYGVLEADTPSESRFSEADVAFMQGFANLLGVALERGAARRRCTRPRSDTGSRRGPPTMRSGTGISSPTASSGTRPSPRSSAMQAETDGSWWKDHIHPEDRERVVSGIAVGDRVEPGTWSAEYRFLRADGSEAYVFDRGFVSRDRQGRAVRMIGSMLDLTRRRQAEEALRRSEERLRGAFAIKTVGVLFWGQGFRLTEVNDAFLGMTGFSREGGAWQDMAGAHARGVSSDLVARRGGGDHPGRGHPLREAVLPQGRLPLVGPVRTPQNWRGGGRVRSRHHGP